MVEVLAGLGLLVMVAAEPVAELVAVVNESARAEVVAVVYAQVPERVEVFGAVALRVTAGVEPPVALAGAEVPAAVEVGPGLEAVVVAVVVPVVVTVLAETDSAGEILVVVVGGTAALDEGTARVLDEMADLRRRTVD